MRTLVTKHWLPLLLLLWLLPEKPHGDYWDIDYYEISPEIRAAWEENMSTGPTKPPTKERFIKWIIADVDRPLAGTDYCKSEIMFKDIHYRFKCYPEHHFVAVPYEELQKACYGHRVPCKNRYGFCRRSSTLMDGVRCVLTSGKRLPDCTYDSIFQIGYAVVTCQWHNETQAFIPESVNKLLLPG